MNSSAPKMERTGLLIGYGSIGRHHARGLLHLCGSLAVVDTNQAARQQARLDCSTARVAETLQDLGEEFPWDSCLAVISTWGPSHAEVFFALADRGVRRILCEKPLATSVADATAMVERANREGLVLGVHHFIRFTRLAPALLQFAKEQALGEPVAMIVDGGAGCLVTNGLHWIDFASTLFGSSPIRVVATVRGDPINPRSPDLMLYGGTATWTFDDGRETIISLSNRSSVGLTARIYFRDAIAETDGNVERVTVRRRDRAAVERFPVVTRTGPAAETIFEGIFPEMLSFPKSLEAALQETASGDFSTSPGAAGSAAVSSCIGALVASRDRTAVDLPIDAASPEGRESWPIS